MEPFSKQSSSWSALLEQPIAAAKTDVSVPWIFSFLFGRYGPCLMGRWCGHCLMILDVC